jgi:hypothetical protein
LSVTDALRIFSIRAVAANQGRASRFLSTDFIF